MYFVTPELLSVGTRKICHKKKQPDSSNDSPTASSRHYLIVCVCVCVLHSFDQPAEA
jgi:hypothetical protein